MNRSIILSALVGGLVLGSLVPATAALADPIDPMPLPGLDGDDPVIFPPVPIPVTPVDIPIIVPGQYGGNGQQGQPAGGQQGDTQNETPQQPAPVDGDAAGTLAPVAIADSYTTDQDEALFVTATAGLLANDTGDAIVVEYLEQPADGAISLERDGSFRYEPADGFAGTDTFDYQVLDAEGRLSEPVTVSIEVVPAVVAPAAASADPGLFAGLGLGVAALALVVTGSVFVMNRRTRRLASA